MTEPTVANVELAVEAASFVSAVDVKPTARLAKQPAAALAETSSPTSITADAVALAVRVAKNASADDALVLPA